MKNAMSSLHSCPLLLLLFISSIDYNSSVVLNSNFSLTLGKRPTLSKPVSSSIKWGWENLLQRARKSWKYMCKASNLVPRTQKCSWSVSDYYPRGLLLNSFQWKVKDLCALEGLSQSPPVPFPNLLSLVEEVMRVGKNTQPLSKCPRLIFTLGLCPF